MCATFKLKQLLDLRKVIVPVAELTAAVKEGMQH
jgi:hypothetical protein